MNDDRNPPPPLPDTALVPRRRRGDMQPPRTTPTAPATTQTPAPERSRWTSRLAECFRGAFARRPV